MSLRLLLAALVIACTSTGCHNVYEDSPTLDGLSTAPPPAPVPSVPPEPSH